LNKLLENYNKTLSYLFSSTAWIGGFCGSVKCVDDFFTKNVGKIFKKISTSITRTAKEITPLFNLH
jgi:hypothetical protein